MTFVGHVLCWLVLAHVLSTTHASYSPSALLRIVIAFTVLAVVVFSKRRKSAIQIRPWIALLLMGVGVLGLLDPMPIANAIPDHPATHWLSTLRPWAFVGLACCAFASLLGRERWLWWLVGATALILFGQRVLVLSASPSPFIDVFTVTNEAIAYLLDLKNPYSQPYTDIYQGYYTYPTGFGYWPGFLIWAAFWKTTLGDFRWGYVFAELMTFVGMAKIAWSFPELRRYRWALPLVWYAMPPFAFILEQAWIDTLLIAGITWIVLFAVVQKRMVAAGLVLAAMCTVKQTFAPFAWFYILWGWRTKRVPKWLVVAIASAAAVMVPFVIVDVRAFITQTMTNLAMHGIRTDALSVPAILKRMEWESHWILLGSQLIVGALFITLSVWLWKVREKDHRPLFLTASAFMYAAIFVFGHMAFCNYYYFLSALVFASMFWAGPWTLSQKRR